MDLEPRLLRYFIAVAEERHFVGAAARLHISQPPLSYAIRQLEQGVGARLLERTSRQVALTEAGKVLYREAQALLRQAEDVRVLVRRVDAGLRGRLRIGFVGSMLYRGLPALLAAMRAELPEVEHVLAELNSHDQIEAVHRGELDLGFIHANPLPEGVQAQDRWRNPSSSACRPAMRWRGAAAWRWSSWPARTSCSSRARPRPAITRRCCRCA
ncbi:LysR family transcriptional regulator [Achromobacter xylosoxidans]